MFSLPLSLSTKNGTFIAATKKKNYQVSQLVFVGYLNPKYSEAPPA